MIRMLDVFAGIGGFSLAARWTGCVETVGFCELDPWCQRVLAKNFPGVPIHDDIKTLTGDALARFGRIDVITGGFPCQPYSVAGKRGGAADDRALWPAMAAVIAESRPTYVLAENVPGIVSMELDAAMADLEALGYACRAVVIPAVGVDAQHLRGRVWIMAHASGVFGRAIEWVESDGVLPGIRVNADASCELFHWGGESGSARGTEPANVCWWPSESGVGRMAHGIPGRVDRLRGLGNAIVPQVAYELMRVMFADEMQEIAELVGLRAELTDDRLRTQEAYEIVFDAVWRALPIIRECALCGMIDDEIAEMPPRETYRHLRALVWDNSQGHCYHCGAKLHPINDFEVDHLVPQALGGGNEITNLVASCRRCNRSKGAKRLEDWRP